MIVTPLESDGRTAASKAERAGSIPARGTRQGHPPGAPVADQAVSAVVRHVYAFRPKIHHGPRSFARAGRSGRRDRTKPAARWGGHAHGSGGKLGLYTSG
jgi:hypothetical protein